MAASVLKDPKYDPFFSLEGAGSLPRLSTNTLKTVESESFHSLDSELANDPKPLGKCKHDAEVAARLLTLLQGIPQSGAQEDRGSFVGGPVDVLDLLWASHDVLYLGFVMDVLFNEWREPEHSAMPRFMAKLYPLEEMEETVPETIHMDSIVASLVGRPLMAEGNILEDVRDKKVKKAIVMTFP
ncbi:hypothetical protein NDU88_001811 [Pleurodeles waltl]|uniref:Uncharacterized protein n=1 Tax=Pleurodeles waltl TaxID=8319 RepID=A0AAV7KX66_PLEWA|nr:hypothetical protein NDU88_001811 [Pleurodeles waltl]